MNKSRFEKYNHSKVAEFQDPGAELKFLGKIGLTIQFPLPTLFTSNRGRIPTELEAAHFEALHYLKYMATQEIDPKRKTIILIHDALRNRIADANMGLVHGCIGKSRIRNPDDATMLSDGSFSLLRAVENFDPWRGWKFSTYACRSILRSFISSISRQPMASLPEDDILSSKATKTDINQQIMAERLSCILSEQGTKLSAREYNILRLRFDEGLTLSEIGDIEGVTKERVRQLQARALDRLREAIEVPA